VSSLISSASFYNGATNTIDPYSLFSVLFFLFYILCLTKDQLLLKLRETKEQLESSRSQVFLLSSALACVKQRVQSLNDKIKEFSRRGDINAIRYNIAKAYKEGKLKERTGLINILNSISQNLCKKKKGKRYSVTTKEFYEVLLTMGGPRLCDFVSRNLDGPHVHSALV